MKSKLLQSLFVFLLITPSLAVGQGSACALYFTQIRETVAFRSELNEYFDKSGGAIRGNHASVLSKALNRTRLIRLIDDVIRNPEELKTIAARSYTHALGFRKIILSEDWGNRGWDVRLHIWPKDAQRSTEFPNLEGRHEHRWDLVSRILTGKMENHSFQMTPASPTEVAVFQRFEAAMSRLNPDQVKIVHKYLNAVEIREHSPNSSIVENLGGIEGLSRWIEQNDVRPWLGLTEAELRLASKIYSKMPNELDPVTGVERYWHEGYYKVEPKGFQTFVKNDLYFHSITDPHIAYTDPGVTTATFILAAPPKANHLPGVMVRPGGVEQQDTRPQRRFYSPEELKADLERFVRYIRSQP